MTGGTQEQGCGQTGGSVLSRTIAGKVVEERPRNWTGDPGGRAKGGSWFLAVAPRSTSAVAGVTNFLPQPGSGAGSPLSQAQAKDVSSASHPSPSISSGQGKRPQKREMGRGTEGRRKARATNGTPPRRLILKRTWKG